MKKGMRKWLAVLLMSMSLTSCAFVQGGESATIDEVKTKLLEDGTTEVTITYTDGREETTFRIPKGEDGSQGTGIASVQASKASDGNVLLTITYTDSKKSSDQIEIPNGNGITTIDSSTDEEGNLVLTVRYTDGRTQEFTIPKGKDGVGIVSAEVTDVDTVNGLVTVLIKLSDGSTQALSFPTARGILSAEVTTDDNGNYVLNITYSDGTQADPITLTRPAGWLSGNQDPNLYSPSVGQDGDFFFDIQNRAIYQKQGNTWVKLFSLTDSSTDKETLTFNLNADYGLDDGKTTVENAAFASPSDSSHRITRGSNALSMGFSLPIPTATNATFVGWYSQRTRSVNAGQFTELTNVFSDMTLYAWWDSKDTTTTSTTNA